MGGISLTLPLKNAPEDPTIRKALQRAVWKIIDERLRPLLKKKASKDILTYYTSDTAYDGFEHDKWMCTEDAMFFVFGDAAGLCFREMHCSHHWALLCTLDAFDAIAAQAKERGAEIGPPETGMAALTLSGGSFRDVVFEGKQEPALAALLGPGQQRTFFHVGSQLAYALSAAQPGDEHEITFLEESKPLAKLPLAERPRVRDLIVRGLCACEPCQALRKKYGLPLAPELVKPKKPKAPPKPLGPAPIAALRWQDAPVIKRPDVKTLKANPAAVVVLDLSAPNQYEKVSASVIKALPSFPVQALGFRKHGLRTVPPEVPRLTNLEVLSLYGCKMKAPLGSALAGLSKLRALNLQTNYFDGLFKGVALPHSLEAIDVDDWKGELPSDVSKMRQLRHIHLGRIPNVPKALGDLPIESLVEPITCTVDPGMLRAWPLRYLEPARDTVPVHPSLEMVSFSRWNAKVLPENLRELPSLRALSIQADLDQLPEWLPSLKSLEVLWLMTNGVAKHPEGFKVLEEMRQLRVLALIPTGATSLPYDFSALTRLETLAISNFEGATIDAFPRGLGALPNLRRFYYTSKYGAQLHEPLVAQVPAALSDPNILRCMEPVALYRMLLPKDRPERMLSRLSEEYWLEDL